MTDNARHAALGKADPMIHTDADWEVRMWAQWLSCSEAELRHAVTAIGPDPDNVRRFLRQAR